VRGLITPKRLAIAVVCVAALVVCCGLAYWQWERFSEAGGTVQNLGYVFQWPLFGLFPAFMVWRIRRLDARRKAEEAAKAAEAETGVTAGVAEQVVPEPVAAPSRPVVTVEHVRAPAPDDEDEELAAYNRMLAELHARDQR
jgi:DNA-binding transcriptional regulator of glucitol operon